MANQDTEINLDSIHQSIIDAITDKFPTLQTVTDYHDSRQPLTVPACLIELTELTAEDDDPGTEQLALLARFEARIIIGFRTPSAKREIRKLATSLATFIQNHRWGQPIGSATVLGCYPDEFSPELDQYEIWRVEWSQEIHFGSSVWTNEGIIPTTVMLSYPPHNGNENDYEEVTEDT